MNGVKLAFIALAGILFFACGSKAILDSSTDVDFSIVPIKGSNGEYQYIDVSKKGKIVINPQFGEARIFRDGLALVKTTGKDGKYGYIDKTGKYTISPVYDYAQDFGEGVAWVQMKDQPPTLINKKGETLMQIDSMTWAFPFREGVAAIGYYSEGEYFGNFIDKNGKSVLSTPIKGDFFPVINEGLYGFQNLDSKKYGFKNEKDELVISEQFEYDDADSNSLSSYIFIDGISIVKSGGKWGIIDKKGVFIVNPQYDELEYDSDGLFMVKVGKKFGWINKKGETIINPQFDNSFPFFGNKLTPVQMGDKAAYVDKKGQIIINPQFFMALPFFGDYAAVVVLDERKLKVGFINKNGDYVIPPSYEVNYRDLEHSKEYIYAIAQKNFGLPMRYYLEFWSADFKPYAKLKEKEELGKANKTEKGE